MNLENFYSPNETSMYRKIKYLFLKILVTKIPDKLKLFRINSIGYFRFGKKQKNCFLLCTTGENNDYFENGLLVAIESIKRTNPGIQIIVFYSDLDSFQKNKLQGCKLIEIRERDWQNDHRPDLTDAAFYRLMLDKIQEFDKVIYIDSDMVVLDSLSEIFKLSGKLIAVGEVRNMSNDFSNFEFVAREENIYSPFLLGFNTGFLCFEVDYWCQDILKKAVEIGNKYGWNNLKNPLNAILNLLAWHQGGFTPIPSHYNYNYTRETNEIKKNSQGFLAPCKSGSFVKVLHFVGPIKPWSSKDKIEKYPKLKRKLNLYMPCYNQFLEKTKCK